MQGGLPMIASIGGVLAQGMRDNGPWVNGHIDRVDIARDITKWKIRETKTNMHDDEIIDQCLTFDSQFVPWCLH